MNPTLTNLRKYGLAGRFGEVAPNTFAIRSNDGCTRVVYHQTEIYRSDDSGIVCIKFDGWATRTTIDRLHALLPPHTRITYRKGVLKLTNRITGESQLLEDYGWNEVTI